MDTRDLIISRMTRNKETFCEFFDMLYNAGLSEITYDYRDDDNFSFRRINDAVGINDISVYFADPEYFDNIVKSSDGAGQISVITPTDTDFSKYAADWNMPKRRQFCKSAPSEEPTSDGISLLDSSHAEIMKNCTSDRARDYFGMAVEYGGECYAIIDGGIRCFLSALVTKKSNSVEINWIYTEPEYREKGYASELLRKVSNRFASDGLTVTYHCAESNIASAKTAIKSGFIETDTEIIFERK